MKGLKRFTEPFHAIFPASSASGDNDFINIPLFLLFSESVEQEQKTPKCCIARKMVHRTLVR